MKLSTPEFIKKQRFLKFTVGDINAIMAEKWVVLSKPRMRKMTVICLTDSRWACLSNVYSCLPN